MRLELFQVDAFTSRVFAGNPAAVCPLESWLPDSLMQAIAAENNLAETAFFVPEGAELGLRWFTPVCEVDLCGHATLASAYVLWQMLGEAREVLTFHTRSGALRVRQEEGLLTLDFPSRPPSPVTVHPQLVAGLGGPEPVEICAARDYLVRYKSEADVLALQPDFAVLKETDRFAVIVTAPGADPETDFVSRFFAPARGINEDPVTGSSHTTLVPYWAEKLNKSTLQARQISKRGGSLLCKLAKDRVLLSGNAALYLRGEITIPDVAA